MFTGLVENIASVESFLESDSGKVLTIRCEKWDEIPTIGASICISGCCLTVVDAKTDRDAFFLSFEVVKETLERTTLGLFENGQKVNLEQSLRPDSRLGGHFVQGHIDGVEQVTQIQKNEGGETRIQISVRDVDIDAVVPKGSINVDGVSLTIANVQNNCFEVALIPTTIQETTLGHLELGDQVNVETDILARTVVGVLRSMRSN